MWKQSPPNAVPIVWLCVLALLFGIGCANSTRGPEEELRLKQASSHFNLGMDYLRKDRVALGLREFLLAESFDPKSPRIHHALGNAYLMRRKPVEAEQHYLRALEIEPTYHEARLNLAILYSQLSRYEESHISRPLAGSCQQGPRRVPARPARGGPPHARTRVRLPR